jgi:toxin ParE1/3/4
MKLIWTEEALSEIEAIVVYIAKDNKVAAMELAERIFTTVETTLPQNPLLGRQGRVTGTRELIVHTSYIVAYRVASTTIEILTVRHTARLWPETL